MTICYVNICKKKLYCLQTLFLLSCLGEHLRISTAEGLQLDKKLCSVHEQGFGGGRTFCFSDDTFMTCTVKC